MASGRHNGQEGDACPCCAGGWGVVWRSRGRRCERREGGGQPAGQKAGVWAERGIAAEESELSELSETRISTGE